MNQKRGSEVNVKRYVVACLAAYLFIFVFEWVFHGVLLKSTYEATAELWRGEEDCIFQSMFAAQLLFPFIFGYIFLKGYENKGAMEGARYGALIAILFIPGHLVVYSVQPMPLNLTAFWIIGNFIELAAAGMIIASIYRQKKTE